MENTILYLVEYAVFMLCFYMLYMALFKGKSDHKFNRFYLVSSQLISLSLPLIKNFNFLDSQQFFSVVLSPIEIVSSGTSLALSEANQSVPIISILAIIYLIISAFFLIKFTYGLLLIRAIKVNGDASLYNNYSIIESDRISSPFSFMNKIYLPKGSYQQKEKEYILEHELSHIRFGHSFEKLFFLLTKALFWWNPITRKYFSELELIHEYQVDEELCKKSSKKHYSEFLLSQINQQRQYVFVNNISSHIKNRILMISSEKTTTPTFIKWSAYLGMFLMVIILHACSAESDEPMIEDNYEAKDLTKKAESYTREFTDTVSVFDHETKKETIEYVNWEMDVFKKPEVMPVFGDCLGISEVEERYECSNNKLLMFVYKNLIYPEEAKESSIEGMVVVKFIVDKNGDAIGPKIVRSLDKSTDQAVLNVIQKMNETETKWISGRQDGENVATEFILPVRFKLE